MLAVIPKTSAIARYFLQKATQESPDSAGSGGSNENKGERSLSCRKAENSVRLSTHVIHSISTPKGSIVNANWSVRNCLISTQASTRKQPGFGSQSRRLKLFSFLL